MPSMESERQQDRQAAENAPALWRCRDEDTGETSLIALWSNSRATIVARQNEASAFSECRSD